MSIVLLGQIGSGKTTLYNKITLSNEQTKSGGNSVTMSVFMKRSCQGQGFQVLDTPGFGSDSNKLDHVAGVISALSEGPLNRIVVVVKFDRTPTIIENVKKVLPAFMDYRQMFTVIISCWDQCKKEDEEQFKKEISQKLRQYKIDSVLFIGLTDTSEGICSQLDQVIAKSEAQNICLTDNDIFKNFDMTEYEEEEVFEIQVQQTKLIEYYRKFYLQALNKIKAPNIPEGQWADYFYALTQFALKMIEDIIQKFEIGQLETIDKLEENAQLKAFQIRLELKTTLLEEYEKIVNEAHKKTDNESHFSKYLKKCNYCNQIWLKVHGCDGKTACGRLIDDMEDQVIKSELPPQRFIVSYKNEKLLIDPDKNFTSKITQPKEQILKNLQRNKQNNYPLEEIIVDTDKIKLGGVGCKRIIEWRYMLPLTKDELTEVLGILDKSICEYVAQQEKLIQERTQNLQSQYKIEFEKKLKEQKQRIKKNE